MIFYHIYFTIIITFWLLGAFGTLYFWLTAESDRQNLFDRMADRETR